jgi:hypothetical protein
VSKAEDRLKHIRRWAGPQDITGIKPEDVTWLLTYIDLLQGDKESLEEEVRRYKVIIDKLLKE